MAWVHPLSIPKITNGWYKPCPVGPVGLLCLVSKMFLPDFDGFSLQNKQISVIKTHQFRQWTLGLRQPE